MTGKPDTRPSGRPAPAGGSDPKPRPGQAGTTAGTLAGKPSGSMVYTVQKGANIVPSWRKG